MGSEHLAECDVGSSNLASEGKLGSPKNACFPFQFSPFCFSMQKDSCKCLLNNVAKMYNVQLKPQQYFEPNALIRKSYKITVGLSSIHPCHARNETPSPQFAVITPRSPASQPVCSLLPQHHGPHLPDITGLLHSYFVRCTTTRFLAYPHPHRSPTRAPYLQCQSKTNNPDT